MNKNVEVEVRGPLSASEYKTLVKFFDKEAEHRAVKNRILIDYSTPKNGHNLENRD